MIDELTIEILSMLPITTLNKVKTRCEAYNTYCIDFKQINAKNGVKTQSKKYSELLEVVNSLLVLKQFETEKAITTNNNSADNTNITSTMESKPIAENKKKGDKAK